MPKSRHSAPPVLQSLGPPKRVRPVDHPIAAVGRFWYPKPPKWPPVASAAVHLIVTIVLVLTIGDLMERPEGARESVFFLPPPQESAPEAGGGGVGGTPVPRLVFAALSVPELARGVLGQGGTAAGTGGGSGGGTSAGHGKAVTKFVTDSVAAPGDSIYTKFEVDNVVKFSDRSAVPQYPLDLLARGVQGEVLARFVVDTSGIADVRSLEIVDSSDPQFTASVRQALPRMRFSPARLNGRRVRQQVDQPFRFKIDLATGAPSDSA